MIVRTPGTIGGKARIDGTRWPVCIAWHRCVEGTDTADDLQSDYPWLTVEQITEAIEYARANWDEVHRDWQRFQGDGDD
jgi:uncharacterized protein (DUF433 family)